MLIAEIDTNFIQIKTEVKICNLCERKIDKPTFCNNCSTVNNIY
jgi:hypothetical protein